MRRQVKHVIKVLLMFSLIICWGISLGYVSNIARENKLINFYFENNDVTASIIKSIEEKEKTLSVVGWKEETLKSAYNPEFNRTVNDLSVLSISGNSSLIMRGPILFKDDKDGCLIDRETSFKLFGSTNAAGREIVYNNRKLIVRGIHKETNSNIIVQLLEDSNEALNGLSIDGTDFTLIKINDFKNQFGLQEMAIDGGIYHGMAKAIAMIFPIVALILILIKVIVHAIKSRRKPILVIIYTLMVLGTIFIFFKVTKLNISIPLDMIPNKWSDFDFWGKLGKEYIEKFKYVLYMKKYGLDIYNIENLMMATLYSILTIILFIINLKVIKISNIKSLIITTTILVLSTFIAVVLIWSKFNFDVNITMLWLIYPLYLCGDYFMNVHEKYLIYEDDKKEVEEENEEIEGAFC